MFSVEKVESNKRYRNVVTLYPFVKEKCPTAASLIGNLQGKVPEPSKLGIRGETHYRVAQKPMEIA